MAVTTTRTTTINNKEPEPMDSVKNPRSSPEAAAAFYERLANKGVTKAEAERRAQVTTARTDPAPSPPAPPESEEVEPAPV